jgi:hypothetical protein
MPPPDVLACRLPGAAVRRAFLQHTALILLVLAGFSLLSPRAALGALAGAAVLATAVLAIAYGFTAHRVWVRLSAAGLSSTGYTGRELSIPWSASVHIKAARRSGYNGHSVVPTQYAGSLAAGMHTIFLPAAITAGSEFAAAIEAWAPAGHPLRDLVSNQVLTA